MKTKAIMFVAIIGLIAIVSTQQQTINDLRSQEPIRDTVVIETDWSVMIRALIAVESEGNADAVNKTSGATGILQLMPIYVREANRIIGEDKYTLDDRYDVKKTLEMFEIVQGKHNPDRNIKKAIRLHNPTAGEWYDKRVMKHI